MKKLLFFVLPIASVIAQSASQTALWNAKTSNSSTSWNLDTSGLRRELSRAPLESSGKQAVIISLPLPDGTLARFEVRESPVFSPAMAAENPDLKTYVVQGLNNPRLRGRVDLTPAGFHGSVFDDSGLFTVEPTAAGGYESKYMRDQSFRKVSCGVTAVRKATAKSSPQATVSQPAAQVAVPVAFDRLRTYRLAIATTAEFTKQTGGSAASVNAAIVTIMNTANVVYERDLGIHFQVVKTIIYTDPANQPFVDSKSDQNLEANQTLMDAQVGTAGYDIGHVFNNAGTSGFGVPGICQGDVKAAGVSVLGNYTLPVFAIEQVAHELGHQISANHTFNANSGTVCKEATRVTEAAYEVGSGITIMSYAGICSGDDSQDLDTITNGFFHSFSILEMNRYIRTSADSCGIPNGAAIVNNAPQIIMPTAPIVPALTPFSLTALVTDPDAADQKTLTYSWEQMDLGGAAPPDDDDGKRSLFRNYAAVSDNNRYFPSLQFIVNNQNIAPTRFQNAAGRSLLVGEVMSSTNRTMTFRLAARDNRPSSGSATFADTIVTVSSAAGPFVVTAPNTATLWADGTPQTVTWNVAKTDLDPIGEKTVRIKLSVDGGLTFPHILAKNIPNTGSATFTLPTGIPATTKARIMVAAEKSIFFDISDVNFTVTAASGTGSSPIIGQGGIISAAGIQQSVAPGSVISIYGSNLAGATAGATAVPLPTTLSGVSVQVNGVAVPLFFVSSGQINAQVPYEATLGEAVVVVTSNGAVSPGAPLLISATAPGVLQFGASRAVVVNQSGAVNNSGVGASVDSTVVAYMTGQGAVTGTVKTGDGSTGSPLLGTKAVTTVTVGGKAAQVSFSGLTPGGVGLMQLNFVIPSLTAGDYPLVVTVGGVSSNALTMTVAP